MSVKNFELNDVIMCFCSFISVSYSWMTLFVNTDREKVVKIVIYSGSTKKKKQNIKILQETNLLFQCLILFYSGDLRRNYLSLQTVLDESVLIYFHMGKMQSTVSVALVNCMQLWWYLRKNKLAVLKIEKWFAIIQEICIWILTTHPASKYIPHILIRMGTKALTLVSIKE